MTTLRRGREPWASILLTLAWSVVVFFASAIEIQLPGTRSVATEVAQIFLIGAAFSLRRWWLTLLPALAHGLSIFSGDTLEVGLETTFVMDALSLPLVWVAHRWLKARELDYLRLGLAWVLVVAIYYYVLQLPLMMATNMVFRDYPWAKVPAAYAMVAEAFVWEALLTTGVTTLAFVAKEEIARRRAAEERLRAALAAQRALVASAPVAVIATTPTGLVSDWNPAAERLFARSAAEAIGQPLPRVCGDPTDVRQASILDAVLAGAALARTEAKAQATGGAVIPIAVSGAPLVDAGAGAVLVMEDLRAELALRAAVERSARMSELGQLLGRVAHELRNPLFGITATLDAFGGQLVGHARLELMGRTLRGQVQQLSDLMLDLLDYGKAGVGERVATSPALPVRLAIDDCVADAAAREVRLEVALPPHLPMVAVNVAQLHQVFRNLVQNAVAFSPRGSTVQVEGTSEVIGGRAQVQVAVLDRGVGFTPADLESLFEPFFSRRKGGTGLGLSLVQRIVEQHGGTVAASNRPEGGARLVVRLPAEVPEPA
ncbi:MAG: PAS domain-containing protein [Deltaproteobacteria bacterium]|nr:PAS domain-containing protein [Deltaproteobacteria bacterium]